MGSSGSERCRRVPMRNSFESKELPRPRGRLHALRWDSSTMSAIRIELLARVCSSGGVWQRLWTAAGIEM